MQRQWLPTLEFLWSPLVSLHYSHYFFYLYAFLKSRSVNPKLKGCVCNWWFPTTVVLYNARMKRHDCRETINGKHWTCVWMSEGKEIIGGKHSKFNRASYFLLYLRISIIRLEAACDDRTSFLHCSDVAPDSHFPKQEILTGWDGIREKRVLWTILTNILLTHYDMSMHRGWSPLASHTRLRGENCSIIQGDTSGW